MSSAICYRVYLYSTRKKRIFSAHGALVARALLRAGAQFLIRWVRIAAAVRACRRPRPNARGPGIRHICCVCRSVRPALVPILLLGEHVHKPRVQPLRPATQCLSVKHLLHAYYAHNVVRSALERHIGPVACLSRRIWSPQGPALLCPCEPGPSWPSAAPHSAPATRSPCLWAESAARQTERAWPARGQGLYRRCVSLGRARAGRRCP